MKGLDARLGRLWFAVQSLAAAAWWVLVFTVPAVRHATLGELAPLPVAAADVPLMVLGSALVAFGVRRAVWVVAPWAALVTVCLAIYATVTGLAGWGVVAMAASTGGSLAAAMLVLTGRIPVEKFLIGPLAFRQTKRTDDRGLLLATGTQLVIFWTLFLVVLPLPVIALERRWGIGVELPSAAQRPVAVVATLVLVLASMLGIWSAYTMTRIGRGTPLPSAMPNRLVVAGPYRWVRNPMAVAGGVQSLAIGVLGGSWLVVVYSLLGGVLWHLFIRPAEEADLADKFGDEYAAYRAAVRTWLPRRSPIGGAVDTGSGPGELRPPEK